MTVQCPKCGEIAVVCRLEPLSGGRFRVSEVVPPPRCPFCGYEWWQEILGEQAERILEENDGKETGE